MELFLLALFFISITLLFLLFIKVSFFLYFSVLHQKEARADEFNDKKICYTPSVSILVPAYNEEIVLENCVKSLIRQDYPNNYEVIIVDDGSTDDTKVVGEALAEKYSRVRFYSKVNGGKASALNYGIQKSRGKIVVCIDADSILADDALLHLVRPLADLSVGAVGGNVKVANRSKLLNLHQATEYIVGLNIQRRAFSQFGCMQVISGAIGAFRKSVLVEVGGYSDDTIVEDMDITVAIAKAGYQVKFSPNAVAYTEAPESIKDFMKQRYRWTIGGFKVLKKYREMIFNKEYGRFGMVGLPYFLIFPWIDGRYPKIKTPFLSYLMIPQTAL